MSLIVQMSKLRIIAALALLGTPLGAQTPSVPASPADSLQPISLDAAVTAAQRNSPTAVQARGAVRTSESGVRSAYAAFLPNLNFSLGANESSGQRQGPTGTLVDYTAPRSYTLGLNSTLMLFDGQRFSNLTSARAGVDAAEASEVASRYRIALDVKTTYFSALAARESESAARAQLEQAEQQLRAASARVRAGSATMSDSLRSVIAVGNARLAVLTAQNEVRTASAALTRLVASPVPVTASASDTLEQIQYAPLDTTQILVLARQGPAVRQAEANYEAARANVRAARGSYLPDVSLSYRRSGSGFDSRFGIGDGQLAYSNTWSVGLSLPVFNNYAREDQVTRAIVQRDVADANLRDAELLARQNLVQQLGVLRTAEERVRIQQASVEAAQEDLRVQQQRYNLGASTLLDLLTSQSALNSARSALIEARLDYRIARAQIEALIGQDLP